MAAKGNSAQGAMSRRKGASYERAMALAFREWWGSAVQRTPMSGAYDPKWRLSGDLMFEERFPFEVEIRNRENWHLEQIMSAVGPVPKWLAEVEARSRLSGLRPMLIIHRNRVAPLVCVRGVEATALGIADVPCVRFHQWVIITLDDFFHLVSPDRVRTFIRVAADNRIDFT